MKKDNFGRNLVIIMVSVILIAYAVMNAIVNYIGAHTYTYERYVLPSKTYEIYWEEPTDILDGQDYAPLYYGEIITVGNGGEKWHQTWYAPALCWYEWMFEEDENYADYKTVVEYWK